MAVPPAKRARHEYVEMLKVIVGPEDNQEELNIHKSMALAKSSFLNTACSQNWMKPGADQVVRLPEHEPEAFEVFVHWIYTERLDLSTMTPGPPQFHSTSYLNLGKIWTLANYIGAQELQSSVADALITKTQTSPNPITVSSIKHVWENSPPNSRMHRFLTDFTVNQGRGSDLIPEINELPLEIIQEAGRIFFCKARPLSLAPLPKVENRCKYHEHAEGEPKCTWRAEMHMSSGQCKLIVMQPD